MLTSSNQADSLQSAYLAHCKGASLELVSKQSGSALETYANVATIGGLVIAVVAALIALWTYKGTAADVAKGHMHAIFRDYLRLRMDRPSPDRDFISYKFYAMEEAFLWVKQARSRLLHRMRRDEYEAWLATISYHICDDAAETDAYLREPGIQALYETEFYSFIQKVFCGCGRGEGREAFEGAQTRQIT